MSFVSLTGLSSTLKAMLSNKTIEPNDGSTPCIEITDIKYEIFMVRIMIEVTLRLWTLLALHDSHHRFYVAVVLRVESAIRWTSVYPLDIAQYVLLTLILWIKTHPVSG